ncbi:hypothetical protein [Pseudofrankia asymbiotica]|uniref:PPM-type phosphatase domain-containing protein n=1 Tax=Pseudofrankia asymbiotica TaxID=1834516 RepID=A0A1V2IF98_9ACTN|nr:hypothetical protein [Pseudofrankia asymbiotica]ONH31121.1 hypothetical protein BL253_10725 [Pseudofrankia asymbiotica]
MILARSVCFWLEKLGSAALEWEDAAAYDDGDPAAGVVPRYVVVDGATEAYDAIRWVEHLAGSFVAETGPDLTPDGLRAWFEQVQRLWAAEAPARFTTVIEEHKFRSEGSFATFLGCRLTGLDGPRARWEAAALGDTVLFHVRAGRLLTHFPPIDVDGFGLSPAGIGTRSAALGPMLRGLELASGEVRAGDVLFVATDALAQWLLREVARDEAALWTALAGLDHDAAFAAIVADQRAAGRMHNDDVTLLRVRLVTAESRALVVSL